MKRVLLLFFVFVSTLLSKAQKEGSYDANTYNPTYSYNVEDVNYLSTSDVQVCIVVYNSKKKDVEQDAKRSAIRMLLYDGIGTGVFARALLPEGEKTSFQKHSNYLYDLYEKRISDFIGKCTIEGKYEKADNKKGTRFVVELRANKLRKDLEQNKIKNQIGL